MVNIIRRDARPPVDPAQTGQAARTGRRTLARLTDLLGLLHSDDGNPSQKLGSQRLASDAYLERRLPVPGSYRDPLTGTLVTEQVAVAPDGGCVLMEEP